MTIQFKTEGNMKIHIEIPDALITLSSLFLLSLINVCIELNRKIVGKIIGKREGKWSNAILRMMSNGISFEELLLKSSIKSKVRNRKQQKKRNNKNSIKVLLN